MTYIKYLILFCGFFASAQTPVLSLEQDTLLQIENGQIISPANSVLFSSKGNIIFKGKSSSYKDILFTLALDSISQEKEGVIYNRKGARSLFTIQQSIINYAYKDETYAVATFVKNDDYWAIYNNLNDSLLAYIPSVKVSNASLFASFYALWNSTEMKAQLISVVNTSKEENMDGLAIMQPVFGAEIVWIWDGTYLYPNGMNSSHPMVWKYENEKLQPVNYPRTQEEWSWDGQGLKPYWGGDPSNQWIWQNGILRQTWNNNYKNEYFIEDMVIRKRFGVYGDNEWEIKGDMPLPLITAVVLGILYR